MDNVIELRGRDLGHHSLRHPWLPLRLQWFDGGGWTRSHLIWRLQGKIVAIVVAADV